MGTKFLKKAGAALMSAAMLMNSAVYSAAVVTAADEPIKVEFEDAEVTGSIKVEKDSGASGGSALKMTEDGTITVKLTVEEGGPYKLTFYAFGIGTDKQQNLSVNGSSQGAIGIPQSTEYQPVELTAIPLKAGENTIVIEKSWGWSQFDYLTAEPMSGAKIEAKQTTPCDQLATVETQSLMAYLAENYGKHIISGQQEIYSGGPHGLETEFEYLKDTTGHYPAIRGFDYGNFCCPLYGSDDGSTDRIIDWVKNKGGIATASYHINVPKDFASYKIGTKMDWAQSTYTAKDTDFSPSKAATAGTKENEYYLSTLQTLAKEFNKLEAEGIPVIWRPLHEAEGGGGENGSWFWGREGSAAYKKLWIYTYEILTNELNCHNLIWEWNSYNFATSKDWYPGDAYVDIIGYDKYSCTDWSTGSARYYHNDSPFSSTFYGIMEKYDSAKMISLAENDCFSTPDKMQEEKAGWLYFCTWYDGGSDTTDFLSNPTFNTKEDTIAMYQSDYCITLDELPKDLYKKEGVTPPDPANTTTSTTTATTTADPNATTTTTAYKFAIQKKTVTIPEEPKLAVGKEMQIDITGAPNASIGGAIGFGTTADDWQNIEWKGNADKDGKLTVHVDIDEMPSTFKSCEVQVWWSNVWNATTEKAIDQPYTIDSCEVHYLMGGALEPTMWGDANCDKTVDMSDVVLIMQALANPNKYGLEGTEDSHITDEGWNLADVDISSKGVTANDALRIQEYLLKKIDDLRPSAK